MNFFESQDKARSLSMRLTLLFATAVVLTFLLIHFVVVSIVYLVSDDPGYRTFSVEQYESVSPYGDDEQFDDSLGYSDEPILPGTPSFRSVFFDPDLALIDLLIVGGMILGASWYRFNELKSTGVDGVAASIGATALRRGSTKPLDRRLYNVVEEIAIASGVPVPRVFILQHESSINACAIGTSPDDAAVCVTRGALELLNRDELQGLVAHEFSHILNGDVRLNFRLIGILFGIELIAVVAYYTMVAAARGGGGDSKENGGRIALILCAFVILLIGSMGLFFGNIIRAAISRQREYLADASAVQFTRNPLGISGTLKKIGCKNVGSSIASSGAEQTSHMFFAPVFSFGVFRALYRTHPDLVSRIRAIEPTFDGVFPEKLERVKSFDEEEEKPETGDSVASSNATADASDKTAQGAKPRIGGLGAVLGVSAAALYGDWAQSAQQSSGGALKIAPSLLEPVPSELDEILVDTDGAKAAFYSILLSSDPRVREGQVAFAQKSETSAVLERFDKTRTLVESLPATTRLLIARVATPLLKELSLEEYQAFRKTVVEFCAADGRLDLFEYTLQIVALYELDVFFRLAKPRKIRYSNLAQVEESLLTTLACLAHEGEETVGDAQKAFKAGCDVVELSRELPAERSYTLGSFTKSLNQLAGLAPQLKKKVVEACWQCVLYDGLVTEREAAILSAVTAALGVPAPIWRDWVK